MFEFYLDKPQKWEDIYHSLVMDGKQHGVVVTGNAQRGGGIHPKAQGEFAVIGEKIKVVVTRKPALLPKSLIESHVRGFIKKKEANLIGLYR